MILRPEKHKPDRSQVSTAQGQTVATLLPSHPFVLGLHRVLGAELALGNGAPSGILRSHCLPHRILEGAQPHAHTTMCTHSHAHAQDQHIKRVHLAVGVQQLGLYPVCGRQGGWSAGGPGRGLGSEPGLTLTLWGVATDSPPQPQGTDRHHRPNERL